MPHYPHYPRPVPAGADGGTCATNPMAYHEGGGDGARLSGGTEINFVPLFLAGSGFTPYILGVSCEPPKGSLGQAAVC